jgi:DNA polymerase III subunit epsilon
MLKMRDILKTRKTKLVDFILTRDIVFFDVETTGLHVIRDRILQLAMVKYHKDGSPPSEFNQIINPGIPISEEAYRIHGIGPKEVANKPTFQQLAQSIFYRRCRPRWLQFQSF